jgi:glycerol-3-phosphate acyltransferase PlsY
MAIGVGYLIGTFPTADIVARQASGGSINLRQAGSGNPGGANAMQVLGARAGAAVMVGDIGKGALVGFRRRGKGVACSVGQYLATFPAYFPAYFPIDVAVAAMAVSNPKLKQRAFTATLASSVFWVAGGLIWWAKGWRNLWGPTPTANCQARSLNGMASRSYHSPSRSTASNTSKVSISRTKRSTPHGTEQRRPQSRRASHHPASSLRRISG